jgi:hypothetical protein
MANENPKYDSGHVIVPVLHPDSGEVHNIAVPEDTNLKDLHSALSDAGYEHSGITTAETGPTEEGTIEESPEFQAATRKIFEGMNAGKKKGESAFYMRPDKSVTYEGEQFDDSSSGGKQLHINVPGDTKYINHVHPDIGLPEPSPKDRETSQNLRMPVYAVSKSGLYMVNPTDQKVTKVFSGTEWMDKDFQGNKKFNDNISKDGYTVLVQTKDGKDVTINAGKDYPIDLLKKIRSEGYNGRKVKNAQAFGPGELKPKK